MNDFGKGFFESMNFNLPTGSSIKLPDLDISPMTGVSHEELTERQIQKQNEILEFLRNVTIEQSKSSRIQFLANLCLAITTIIIGIIAIIRVFADQNNTEYKTLYEHTLELEKEKLKQDLTISELSNNLLYLQNKVKTLEKQALKTSKKAN